MIWLLKFIPEWDDEMDSNNVFLPQASIERQKIISGKTFSSFMKSRYIKLKEVDIHLPLSMY